MTNSEKYIYIIGAGFAGQMIAGEIVRKKIFGTPAAFIDDDPELIGKTIDGIPVLGPIDRFISFLRRGERDEAVIAMPSVSKERISKIYETLTKAGFTRIKILPAISQIVDGSAHLIQTRDSRYRIAKRKPCILTRQARAYNRSRRFGRLGIGAPAFKRRGGTLVFIRARRKLYLSDR